MRIIITMIVVIDLVIVNMKPYAEAIRDCKEMDANAIQLAQIIGGDDCDLSYIER